jgi:hypothetical protein
MDSHSSEGDLTMSATDSSGSQTGTAPQEVPIGPEPEPSRESLIDAIADLLQMMVNWLRQEAADIMREKVVLPAQRLGLTLASAMAAGCLMVIGSSFVFVALLLLLAAWLGWPGALLLVGGTILLGAGLFTAVKRRNLQK